MKLQKCQTSSFAFITRKKSGETERARELTWRGNITSRKLKSHYPRAHLRARNFVPFVLDTYSLPFYPGDIACTRDWRRRKIRSLPLHPSILFSRMETPSFPLSHPLLLARRQAGDAKTRHFQDGRSACLSLSLLYRERIGVAVAYVPRIGSESLG